MVLKSIPTRSELSIKSILVIILFLAFAFSGFGADKYWVFLKDKKEVTIDPYQFYDKKAIDRRLKNGIPLVEFSDLPINESYRLTIESNVTEITGVSRWFNAVACWMTPDQKAVIENFDFVKEIVSMRLQMIPCDDLSLHEGEKLLLQKQVQDLGLSYFKEKNLTGKGVRICIIDAGFPDVDKAMVFDHIRKNKRIIKTFDFKKNKEFVYDYNSHGTSVLSCIAGKDGDRLIGLAIDAEFLLARTERPIYEGIKEEEDWLEAVEWADINGVDIINSSLGYTSGSHFLEDMNGSSLISRAGNLAARKGILVVNAAGNEGMSNWKYVGAPADADSVLTVGGINPWTGIHTSFSSYGPTADFRKKPNVTAFGHVMAYGEGRGIHETQGTSFASPLIAGFAACVLQNDSSLKTMELFRKIESMGRLYPYYDYAHGYGTPSAFFLDSVLEVKPTFKVESDDNQIKVIINSDAFEKAFLQNPNYHQGGWAALFGKREMHVQDQYSAMASDVLLDQHYFYYHVENELNHLSDYHVLNVLQPEVLTLSSAFYLGKKLRFHYKGYTYCLDLTRTEKSNDQNTNE